MTGRKADGVRFGILGLVVFALPLGLHLLVLRRSLDQPVESRAWPDWIRFVEVAGAVIPWLIGAGLLVLAITRKRWVPLVAFAATQILCIAVVSGLLILGPTVSDYATRVSFDPATWKAENQGAPQGVRVRMVDDLLRKHRLVGMTREQVDGLLGVPPRTNYFKEYDYVYWLGPERGLFSIDSEWLVVKFERGVVVAARVVTD